MNAREQYEEQMATLTETIAYAERVVSRMPRDTLEERRARAAKYTAILGEWHQARLRWKIVQP